MKMNRQRWTRHIAVLALTALLVGPAGAQDGEDGLRFSARQPGIGVRALGMGGAGAGGLADLSALYSNPAGLGYLKGSLFSGGLTSFTTDDDAIYSVSGFREGTTSDVSDTGFDHVGYAYRVPTRRGALVVAANVQRVQTFSRELFFNGTNGVNSATEFFLPLPGEYAVDVDPGNDGVRGTADDVFTPTFTRELSFIGFETYAIDLDIDAFEAGSDQPFFPAVTTGSVTQQGVVTEEGNMYEFSLGGALEAARGVMVGLSVNIPYGKWEFNRTLDEVDFQNDNDGLGGTVDFESMTWTETIESDLVGVNLRAGVSLEAARDLRVGFTIETPTYYSISEDFATFLVTRFDDGFVGSYGRDFDQDVGAGVFDYEVVTPWRLGAGLGYRIGDLTLLADAEFVDWSQLELDSDNYPFLQENQDISQNLEQVVNTRFGAEYELSNFVVRGGFGYQPDPRDIRPDLTSEANRVDRDKTFWSVGASYVRRGQFAIDFGFSQERFDDRFVPYDVTNAPVVDEEVVRSRASIGVRVFL
jgi:long-subunit fatty acid transport protein